MAHTDELLVKLLLSETFLWRQLMEMKMNWNNLGPGLAKKHEVGGDYQESLQMEASPLACNLHGGPSGNGTQDYGSWEWFSTHQCTITTGYSNPILDLRNELGIGTESLLVLSKPMSLARNGSLW